MSSKGLLSSPSQCLLANAPRFFLRLNRLQLNFDSMAATLEDIISAKLAAMGLGTEDNTTFVLGIVEEDSFEPEVHRRPRLSRSS